MELLADDVVIIAAGKLVRQGPVETVLSSMTTQVQVRVRTPEPEKLIAELGSAATAQKADDGALLLTGIDAPTVGAAALRASVELHELTTARPDLEAVFLDLTAGKAAIR
jgi:ABC-2 type transport system ATP-binding protein